MADMKDIHLLIFQLAVPEQVLMFYLLLFSGVIEFFAERECIAGAQQKA